MTLANFSIAREVYEAIGWTSTMNYAVLLHNLGVCCFRQGKEAEAQKCYTEARAVYCGVLLAEDSPQFAALLEDMQAAGMDAERPASPKLQVFRRFAQTHETYICIFCCVWKKGNKRAEA